ncbi:MAG: hypothetical protein HYT77_07750 [Deltaproteobacteria bacterium]|nr:hypothetical protein [Deltaproteobacteria bacterium]
MNQWYVVQTKPRHEEIVKGQLVQAGYQIFLPKMKAFSTNQSYFKPLFPSYLFVCSDFENNYLRRMVHFTRGVLRIIGDGERPAPVHSSVMETLINSVNSGQVVEQELLLRQGDSVRVKSGVLKDLIGIIEKNVSTSGRVGVLFRWFSGKMRAHLHYRQVEVV